MENIFGNVLIWSDQHFGIKGNSPNRQKICIEVTKKVLDYIKENNISTVISGGDWFHSRNQVDVSTINIAYRCLKSIAKKCRCIMILGNHDLYNKTTVDVNSVNMFQDIDNVEIISKPTEVEINNKRTLLVPWLSDLSQFSKETFDFMIGHFEISSKYLINSYIEDNQTKFDISKNNLNFLKEEFQKENLVEKKSNEFLGNFIDLAKKTGTIFAGHIHKHSESLAKGRIFIFIGSPYQQTIGDVGNECGFYHIQDNGKYKFVEITDIPKHIILKISDILKEGIEKFDFTIVKNNIVQKQYDIDISNIDESKINQKIMSFRPFEELVSDYKVQMDFSINKTKDDLDSIELIKKSKLDYIQKYIDNIDEKSLIELKIEKDKLFNVMKKYYDKVVGE